MPLRQAKGQRSGNRPPSGVFNMECQFVGERVRYEGIGILFVSNPKAGKGQGLSNEVPQCEQVNVVPVRGTRCVDELVKDNTTYYYVAIAITSTGTSTTSEEAIAEVPAAGKRNPPPPDADSYPACRVPVASSQPSATVTFLQSM